MQPVAGNSSGQAASRPILPNRYRFTPATADFKETACALGSMFARALLAALLIAKVENNYDVV
jgi:hypothetical protein